MEYQDGFVSDITDSHMASTYDNIRSVSLRIIFQEYIYVEKSRLSLIIIFVSIINGNILGLPIS